MAAPGGKFATKFLSAEYLPENLRQDKNNFIATGVTQ